MINETSQVSHLHYQHLLISKEKAFRTNAYLLALYVKSARIMLCIRYDSIGAHIYDSQLTVQKCIL